MHIVTTDHTGYHVRELIVDSDTTVSSLVVNDLEMRIGGTAVTLAGIGGVHTAYRYRNMGYMRMLYEDTIQYMVDNGYCVSALFGIENFYNKWGYATCLANYTGQIKTRDAETANNTTEEILVRPVQSEDMRAIVHLYNQQNTTRSASIARNAQNYTEFSKGTDWEYKAVPLLWEDENKNMIAYAVIDKDPTAVRLIEISAVEDRYFPAVLYHLASLAIEKRCENIELKLPPEHPFAEYTQRYGTKWKITYPSNGDGMMRIINQTSLFAHLLPEFQRRLLSTIYSEFTGILTLQTNLGTIHLDVHLGKCSLTADNPAPFKLLCTQDQMIQLLMGYRSVRDVVNAQNVEILGNVIPLLNALFPKGIPYMYMPDHF